MKVRAVLFLLAGFGMSRGSVAMELVSRAFTDKSEIPIKYTCEGEDMSPPFAWTGAPAKTKSFALIVDDPDAPDPEHPQRTWVHWLVYNWPASSTSMDEGIRNLPHSAAGGLNDWNRTRYGGPCPPVGRHRYFFKLYALDTMLSLHEPDKKQLEKAMHGHILEQATLVGTYIKKSR